MTGIEVLAARAGRLAQELQQVGGGVRRAQHLAWRGAAGEAYREQVADLAASVERTATAVDRLHHALRRHAAAVHAAVQAASPLGPTGPRA